MQAQLGSVSSSGMSLMPCPWSFVREFCHLRTAFQSQLGPEQRLGAGSQALLVSLRLAAPHSLSAMATPDPCSVRPPLTPQHPGHPSLPQHPDRPSLPSASGTQPSAGNLSLLFLSREEMQGSLRISPAPSWKWSPCWFSDSKGEDLNQKLKALCS